jgi:hypothetical protein
LYKPNPRATICKAPNVILGIRSGSIACWCFLRDPGSVDATKGANTFEFN